VSASFDKTLRVWDLETGICLRVVQGHSDTVMSVSVSPDGRRAVSASLDKTLRVWDLETGECLRVFNGHREGVFCAGVSPDGRQVVSAGFDKTLRVWDVESGVCLAAHLPNSQVLAFAISPQAERIVFGAADGHIYFLTPINFPPPGPAILTAFDFGLRNADFGMSPEGPAARCPYCATYFEPSAEVVSAIREHSGFPNPTSEMFDDPRLLAACPHCGKPLKFNPFFVHCYD